MIGCFACVCHGLHPWRVSLRDAGQDLSLQLSHTGMTDQPIFLMRIKTLMTNCP
jgi:hypothetical protein